MKKVITILLLTSTLFSFEFIGYKSGMTQKEIVIKKYKENKLIIPEKQYSSEKTFNKEIAKNILKKDYQNLKTNELFFEKEQLVTLFFTKKSKRLYKIKIRFTNTNENLISDLKKNLNEKYEELGNPNKKSLSLESVFSLLSPKVEENIYFKINKDSYIIFNKSIIGKGMFNLTYIDKIYENLNKKEIMETKVQENNSIEQKDMNKF